MRVSMHFSPIKHDHRVLYPGNLAHLIRTRYTPVLPPVREEPEYFDLDPAPVECVRWEYDGEIPVARFRVVFNDINARYSTETHYNHRIIKFCRCRFLFTEVHLRDHVTNSLTLIRGDIIVSRGCPMCWAHT